MMPPYDQSWCGGPSWEVFLGARWISWRGKLRSAHEDTGEVLKKAQAVGLTPQNLKRAIRSTAAYLEKRMEEINGNSSFLTDISIIERYVEALHELMTQRDLLTQILEGVDAPG